MKSPDYPGGTIADVMPGALASLGLPISRADDGDTADRLGLVEHLDGVRRVAVLLIDGMGYHQLPLMAPHAPFLASLDARRITCCFPSTTPTSLVSLTTGVAPGSHGVLAFFSAVPGTGRILNHTKWTDDPDPRRWQPVPPLFVTAAAHGIEPTVVNRPEYQGSGLSEVTTRGARYRPASTVDELADAMLAALADSAFVYGYHPELDKAGHEFGLDSPRWRAATAGVDRLLTRLAEGLPDDTALIVTSDHGQLDVPADRRVDLDQVRDGVRLIAGEPRVRYLHTEPGAAEDVLAAWRALADHAAWIGTREEVIETGWYGPMNQAFAERIGDVVLVCRDDWALLSTRWDSPNILNLVAMHGALTQAEMDIPLLVIRGG